MSEILDFYNFLPNKNGVTIDDIWYMSFEELDKCHNFIQYLFPTQEISQFHPEAPLLTEKDITEFKEDIVLRANLLFSFNLMLRFFGLNKVYHYNGDCKRVFVIEKADNYDERKEIWQGEMNHNYLRITRILTCLMLCGLEKEAKAFLDCLTNIMYEEEEMEGLDSYIYWFQAVHPVENFPEN